MSTESTSTLAKAQPTSVKDYLALPAYKDRFSEVLGKRANQFMAAIVASSQLPGLKDAEPRSVIAAAMVAATLDLPVNPTLGQAHLVAYGDGQGNKVAQFQIGYKGLIQLALRSGQYKRLNAGPVNGSVFKGYDMVGEPVLDWTAFDPVSEVTGYFCAFETLNGFLKVVYWSKEQAEAHAKRFSKAYAKGYSTPWKSDFDSMATKTVIKAALGKWGLLSVEMQKAVVHDQGAQTDVDTEVRYVDGEDQPTGEAKPITDRPPPPPRAKKGAAAVRETVDATVEPVAPITAAEGQPQVPVKQDEPANKVPKTSLAADESLVADITVTSVEAGNMTMPDGAKQPSVKAVVTGDFVGTIYALGHGETVNGSVVASKPWVQGATLRASLKGRSGANGVRVVVESVNEQEKF